MPADLFYFISSLPALRWGEKPPLRYDAFLTACQEQLGPELTAQLKAISLIPGGQPASTTLAAWEDWETYLRNAIAESRAAKLRKNAAAWLRAGNGLYPGDRKRLEDALNQPTPRDREQAIDLLRWQQLEHLAAMHQFDVAALELYTLKLLLSEKHAGRNLDAGKKAYQQLVEQGLNQAKEQQGSTSA
ncbi:MAG TPA: DUF2764 family protein [Lentisphaeria bacterium]|nr:DUF2764 family protein [Lentisphaeria bacterium]